MIGMKAGETQTEQSAHAWVGGWVVGRFGTFTTSFLPPQDLLLPTQATVESILTQLRARRTLAQAQRRLEAHCSRSALHLKAQVQPRPGSLAEVKH